MSNNKQSSLDYYITKLTEILGPEIIKQISMDDNERIARLEKQAKAIHKEETVTAMNIAFRDGLYIAGENYDESYKSPYDDWEDYYNKTFEDKK